MSDKQFYAEDGRVWRNSGVSSTFDLLVADCPPDTVDGAAETIATALNFQDRAQELLVQAASALRLTHEGSEAFDVNLAAEIEEFLVNV